MWWHKLLAMSLAIVFPLHQDFQDANDLKGNPVATAMAQSILDHLFSSQMLPASKVKPTSGTLGDGTGGLADCPTKK